jgi:hypothetical protein
MVINKVVDNSMLAACRLELEAWIQRSIVAVHNLMSSMDHCIQVVVYYGPMLFMVRTPDYTPPERIYIILILHNPIDINCQGVYKKKIIA